MMGVIPAQGWYLEEVGVHKKSRTPWGLETPYELCIDNWHNIIRCKIVNSAVIIQPRMLHISTGLILCTMQGSTIAIKSPYVITYICENFDICDVRGQKQKSIYQSSYLLSSGFPNYFSEACSYRQKLTLKFEKTIHALTVRIYFKKYTVWR